MFCYQCEQTAKGQGCTISGVCGKQPDVATLQDLLVYALKGLSQVAVEGRKVGVVDHDVNVFTLKGLFSTLTNVNFDTSDFITLINRCVTLRESLKAKVKSAGGTVNFAEGPAVFQPEKTVNGLIRQGEGVGVQSDTTIDPDIHSLQQTLIYGLKGIAAYADHAQILGQEDEEIYSFMQEGLAATLDKHLTMDDWVALVLKCGKINLRTMEILDAANTGTYGHPVPVKVPLDTKRAKQFLFQAMISRIWMKSLSRQKARGSMSIPMARCCHVTATLS